MEDLKPNQESGTGSVNYGELFNLANTGVDSDLSVVESDESVNIEQGRATLEATSASVQEFREKMMPGLGLNDRLSSSLVDITDEILTWEAGILVDNQAQARFITYSVKDGGVDWDPDGKATIEMGSEMIQVKTQWIDQAASKIGMELNDDQKAQLGINWLVWHELGHGLQKAYSISSEQVRSDSAYKQKSELHEDAFRVGISEPYFGVGDINTYDATIEKERFAEGFAQMLIGRYVEDELGLSPEQADAFRQALTPDERIVKMGTADGIARAHIDSNEGQVDYKQLYQQLRSQEVTMNSIGYGSPYAPEKIQAIISAANHLSETTPENRFSN